MPARRSAALAPSRTLRPGMRQTAGVKLNRVHHIAIIAADHQASKRFYCDVLGCELLTEVYRRTGIPGWVIWR